MTAPDGFRTMPEGGAAAPPFTRGPYSFSEDITFNGNLRKSPGRYYLEEYFQKVPNANAVIGTGYSDADATAAANLVITTARVVANKDFELLGTHADIADFSWSTTCGGLLLETGSADNDQVIILPHLDTAQTAWTGVLWGTENQVIWETTIRTTAVITPVLIWAGLKLTNTPVIATDADQVFFRFSTDDTDAGWVCESSIGGTDTATASGVTVAINTTYNFRIEIDSDRKASFYINDVFIYRTTALTNDINLIPYIGLQQLGSGDSSLILVNEKISRIIFE